MKTFAAIWTTISLFAVPAFAAGCEDVAFEGSSFTVCTADPKQDSLRLFLNGSDEQPLGTFDKVESELSPKRLLWAMNGGMYHSDRSPVGHYIEGGNELAPLVTREGPGNFGLLPNGVLCLSDGARVIESREFRSEAPVCRFATQSGPMLVIEGALHPKFLENSDSRKIRNGVGVTNKGLVVAAISNDPVNFHTFGRLFRDALQTPNALFLDGTVSRLYALELNRHDRGFPMGPILGVVIPGN